MIIHHFILAFFWFLQHNMPLRVLYTMVLEHDIKVGNSASETVGLLQQKEFYQVLYFGGGYTASLEDQTGASQGPDEAEVLMDPAEGPMKPLVRGGGGEERRKRTPSLREKGAFCKACSLTLCPHPSDTFSCLRRNCCRPNSYSSAASVSQEERN